MYRKLRCAWRLAASIWDYTRISNSGEMISCSHELRLYWHRLCRSWWRLAVTNWGSGPGDVFQSLAEAQIQATSCSHYLRLCMHRVLRLGWRLPVTTWGYALYRFLRLRWGLSVTSWGYTCRCASYKELRAWEIWIVWSQVFIKANACSTLHTTLLRSSRVAAFI